MSHKYDTSDTFDKLLVKLRKLEKDATAIPVSQDKAKKAHVHAVQQVEVEDLRTLVMQLQSRVNKFEKHGSAKTKPKHTHQVTCWQCGQVGHIKSGCRNKPHLNMSRPLDRGNKQAEATQPRK